MAELDDELNELLRQANPEALGKNLEQALGEAPAATVAPASDLDKALGEIAPAPAPQSDLDRELAELSKPEPGLWERFSGSFGRQMYNIEQAPAAFGAQLQSATGLAGGQEAADLTMALQALEQENAGLYQPTESFKHMVTEDWSRFLPWAAEMAGTATPYLIGAMGLSTGGAGVGALAARQLAARAIAPTVSKFLPQVAGTATMMGGAFVAETADTAETLFEKTGTTQGGTALAAGGAKAALEGFGGISTVGRHAIGRMFGEAGETVAKESVKEVAKKGIVEAGKQGLKTAGEEALQEGAQSAVDVVAKAYATAGQKDPYNMWGSEALWEIAEGAAAGALLGGPIGTAAAAVEQRRPDEGFRADYTSPVLQTQDAVGTSPVLQAPGPKVADSTIKDVIHPVNPPMDDPLSLSVQLKQLFEGQGPAAAELGEVLEANTQRYAVTRADGTALPYLYSDTQLEAVMAGLPQGEQLSIKRVDQGSLNLRELSADVLDLSRPESGKVWFLPEVPEAKRAELLERYRLVQQVSETVVSEGAAVRGTNVEQQARAQLEGAMRPLLAEGLRVTPSYGRSFWYNGRFKGEEVAAPGTGRSKQLGLWDSTTGQITLPQGMLISPASSDVSGEHTSMPEGMPVAVDLRTFKPGEISGVPVRAPTGLFSDLPGWQTLPGVTPEAKARALAELDIRVPGVRPSATQVLKLLEQGIWYEPHKSAYGLVTKRGLNLRDFTYGVRRDRLRRSGGNPLQTESSKGVAAEKRVANLWKGKSSVQRLDPAVGAGNPAVRKYAEWAHRQLQKYTPKIDRLMRDMGMPGGVVISVAEVVNTSVSVSEGIIYVNPAQMLKLEAGGFTTGSRAVDLNSALLHELGHVVTLNLWRKLKVQQKIALKNAYNRALLADRMQTEPEGRQSRVMAEGAAEQNLPRRVNYYQTFPEWLAEEFRRVARTDTEIRHDFELSLLEVAKGVESFYGKYEKSFGMRAALDLRHPDAVFGALIKQLREGEKRAAPLRARELRQELYRLADGIQWTPELVKVMDLVMQAVESTAAMNIADLPVVLTDTFETLIRGTPEAGTVGRYSQVSAAERPHLPGLPFRSKTGKAFAVLELAVASLKAKDAYAKSKEVITQGWMHAYIQQGLLSDQELAVLAGAARAEGIDLGSHTKSNLAQHAKSLGLTGADLQNYLRWRVEELLAVEFVSARAFKEASQTIVQKVLNKIIAAFRNIQALLMENGYHYREQLLREIFNGTIANKYKVAQAQQKVQLQPSNPLLPADYELLRKADPDSVRYHVRAKEEGGEIWLSPLAVKALAENELNTRQEYYKRLLAKVDPKAWGDPALRRGFTHEQQGADGIQGALVRGGLEAADVSLDQTMRGMELQTPDHFSMDLQEDLQWSQQQNADVLGITYDESAPMGIASFPIRDIADRLGGMEADRKHLTGVAADQDRIGFFSRLWWGLQQLAQINRHIPGLRAYVQYTQQMAQRTTAWMTRADETARAWEKLPRAGRDRVGEAIFWMAEMRYLSAAERTAGVVRQPTDAEKRQEFVRRRLTQVEIALVQRIQDDFADFLTATERVSIENIVRKIRDPATQAKAIAEVKGQMAALRAKPYFPFVRFGRHTITVRDADGKVVWFSAYDSPAERNRNLPKVAAQHPGMDIQYGRVPDEVSQYMGLPPVLLQNLKATLNLTKEQQDWLDEFQAAHLPGNSHRRRWLKKEGTAGYSMDAFRAYASYFQNGAKSLAKMEFNDRLLESIDEVKESRNVPVQLKNAGKRQMIIDYMEKHYKYMMSNPRDFSGFRSFTAVWQLGFCVTAAGMNLTQIPMFTSPYLRSTFGVAASGSIRQTMKMFKRGATTRGLGPAGEQARLEMIDQGRITIGQAAELGAFAEGNNLSKLNAGTKVQRAYRQFSYAAMFMFSKVEQFNRELTFRMAWDLAMKYPDNKKLEQIADDYLVELGDLIARRGFSHQEAVAFLYARETIDRTQGNYAPWAKPVFLQNRWVGAALIFFQYMQMAIHAFRWNGAFVQMLLISTFLYGLQGGLPGGEDMEEVLKTIGWKFFGQDWNLSQKAREYVRHWTKGGPLDEVGPDLLMHGISRYGFGVGMLPEGWAMPVFDVSGNGSMGKVVPGMAEALRNLRWKSDWEGAVASAATGIAGAGMGPVFALLQYFTEPPGTTDSKRWEAAVQRLGRDVSKAYRYAQEGETSKQGGRVVKFDIRDPEDAATLLAQAFGARPTRVSQYWEATRAVADNVAVYEARKLMLYAQLDEARRSDEPGAVEEVKNAMLRFNEDLKAAGLQSMSISGEAVRASVRSRERTRALQEQHLPLKKSHSDVFEKIMDLYPGALLERKPVR